MRGQWSNDGRQAANEYPPLPPPASFTHLTVLVELLCVRPRAKGFVPLPGVKTRAHADEVVGCLGWFLVQQDVEILDAAYSVSGGRGGSGEGEGGVLMSCVVVVV